MTACQGSESKSNADAQLNMATPRCELKGICYELFLCVCYTPE